MGQVGDNVQFVKSSFCVVEECVEVARLANGDVAIRDSKNLLNTLPVFTTVEWQAFV